MAQRDLMLGSCVLEEGGIMIMDDYLNPNWLGVPEGTMLFLNHQDKVRCPQKDHGARVVASSRLKHERGPADCTISCDQQQAISDHESLPQGLPETSSER
jgi:hypothetical protein